MAQPKPRRTVARRTDMSVVNPHAAGIDVGAQFHVVAVGPECAEDPVRSFRSFTADLHELARWLRQVKVTTVVMESTGIYWLPVFEILESYGFEVLLVNAREAKSVPGRKSDVNDAQWLQKLHRYGLLRASFRPRQDVATLRSYLRQRERLLEYAASHIQHMQKAMMQMNVQLHHVVQDITGVTGMKIIRAIVAGERDTDVLAQHRDMRCKASIETIREALGGHYQPEHVFELTQAVALYDFYQTQVTQCDQRIEIALKQLQAGIEPVAAPLPAARHRGKQSNDFSFDVRAALYGMLGVDLTQIHGLGPYVALKLIAECGND
ncbi:IS110 family transposase, partial [Paraburkholderia tuberum]|uniref:IS110 family transposase n=2 Tax=Paraburkholderia TaxID=1822464 RepID=UPI0005548FF3